MLRLLEDKTKSGAAGPQENMYPHTALRKIYTQGEGCGKAVQKKTHRAIISIKCMRTSHKGANFSLFEGNGRPIGYAGPRPAGSPCRGGTPGPPASRRALHAAYVRRCVGRAPPHPPQCAHWGTFPPQGGRPACQKSPPARSLSRHLRAKSRRCAAAALRNAPAGAGRRRKKR